jgi:hypothetical protein
MPKNSIPDWDGTPINNEDVGGIDLRENIMKAPAVNNAFREVMAQIADLFVTDVTFSTAQKNQFLENIGVDGLVDVRRNRIVNHDMRRSQENGTTAGTANGRYPVDQWAQYFVTSAGTLTVAQVASVTPAGSPNRLRATVTVADASLAAGEYWTLTQNLEGSNVADFQYGGASAKNSVLRFGFKGPAGTYAVHLGNSATNRSYVALFTIGAGEANTDTVQTVSIPGDTTGTWLTADGVIGLTLDIVLACGSTFQGTTGWQAGNILGTSAVTNGMGTGSSVFELFDVGLKLDPDATGVYGQYEVGEVHPVYRSERYWESTYPVGSKPGAITDSGIVAVRASTTNSFTVPCTFRVQKCKIPNITAYNPASGSANSWQDMSAGLGYSTGSAYASEKTFCINVSAGVDGNQFGGHWVAIARLS